MSVKIYEYAKCSTCRRALKFLDTKGVGYRRVPIVDTPPSMSELKRMLKTLKQRGGDIRKLFNTSGQVYREMKLGERLKSMTEVEALKLLAGDGKLIKRPFVLTEDDGLVGFRESEWKQVF